MKTKSTNIIMQNKNIILIALAVAFILLLPLLAMQFTDEVAWSCGRFRRRRRAPVRHWSRV